MTESLIYNLELIYFNIKVLPHVTNTYNSKILYSQTSISFYVVIYFKYHKHLVLIHLFIFSTSFHHQRIFGTKKFNKKYKLVNNYKIKNCLLHDRSDSTP